MNSTFVTVAVIGILAVASPGPDFLVVTRNSLLYSKRVGLATALGIAVGNIWWIAASVMGISLIISKTVILFNTLKWLGALYLIYIGMRSLRTKKKDMHEASFTEVGNMKTLTHAGAFKMGILTNILNAKCAMFFLSFFSIVITPTTPILAQCLYGLEIMIISVCWFSLLATVLSVEKIKRKFLGISHWFDRITGALLIGLGFKVALYQQK